MAKVSTYLNFPTYTEEVFLFYKSIFGGEFEGGIRRFGDFPPPPGAPEMSERDKNLVLHVALPILGGQHTLMGTDAPESMGFVVIAGNHIHINLELDTKEETDRLFKALSEGAEVTMPLQDTLWGAYYGSLTDKYGVQWMFNWTEGV